MINLPQTAREIGALFGAEIVGSPDRVIETLAPIDDVCSGALSFLSDKKHRSVHRNLKGSVILTKPELVESQTDVTYLAVNDPRKVFFTILGELNKGRTRSTGPAEISILATIDSTAQISPNVGIEKFVTVGAFSQIKSGVILRQGCIVGNHVTIGEESELHSHVMIYDGVTIGKRVKIFAGSVIGSEGFGLLSDGASHVEIPQVGTVIIEDDVRIGANCTVDRGTLSETRIGRGTKIDNLVHIAHNCHIGQNCILCAQVGLGGSTVLEDNVVLGGQVGIGDHVTVGKNARMGGQSGSSTNVRGGDTYFLTPALPMKEVVRIVKALRRLPSLFGRIRLIEKKEPRI